MTKSYIIKSVHRPEPNCYFVAIHGYTPFFSEKGKAKQFNNRELAIEYARRELFTDDSAFRTVEVQTTYNQVKYFAAVD